MTAFTTTTLNYPQESNSPIRRVMQRRPPTNTENFILGDEWLDRSAGPNGQWWKLTTIFTGGLIWVKSSGGLGIVESLVGNNAVIVGPDGSNNINVLGDTTSIVTTGNAGTHTLTITTGPAVATTYTENSGTASPVLGNLNILATTVAAGSTPIKTVGAGSTVTIDAQISQAIASSDATKIGLAAFNTTDFIVDANGWVSLSAVPIFNYVQINHASSPYTVTATDFYISCDPTAGTITVKIPNAPTQYEQYIIKDRTGHASVNNISVTTVGGAVTIDGQTTYTMAGNFGSIQLLFNGTSYEVF